VNMKHIVAVASGKGGVGKSTVAVNLAVALANQNKSVALIDCDFYGPSVPTLMGGGELKVDANEKFIPAFRYGVKYISIAFFLKNHDDAVIWRGPMFSKAITQLFSDVNWGDVDIAIVDMPPGTGDAQLSLSQQVALSGAIMVTTPQEVALVDVRRAVNMFSKVNVPVLGVVENMSGFIAPDGKVYEIFGSGGGAELSSKYEIPYLGSIPLEIGIREGGDRGEPVALDKNSNSGKIFDQLAEKLIIDLNSSIAKVAIAN
jgi:ATP-binding protein involved in chromosome partitioning